MHSLRSSIVTRVVVGLTASAAAGGMALVLHAAPQDALGSGRGLEHSSGSGRSLDRGLRQGSGGYNTPVNQEDLRSRNLVVTGNVAGGRGFRGSVGYTADRDFRGASSDDVSYGFRAGSAFSDPSILRAGTTGDRLNVARSYANIEYGRASVPGSVGAGDQISTRLRLDQSTLRLSTPETRRAMSDLTTAAIYDVPDGSQVRMQTGGFTGVRASIDRDAIDSLELGLYDTARLKQDLRAGRLDKRLDALQYKDPLRPAAPGTGEGTALTPAPSEPGATRIDTGIKAMDAIVQSLDRNLEQSRLGTARRTGPDGAIIEDPAGDASRAAGKPSADDRRSAFARELDSLRREIRGDRPLPSEGDGKRDDLDKDVAPPVPATGDKPLGGEKPPMTDAERAAAKQKSLDDIAAVLQHGQRIVQLSDTPVTRVREILAVGEAAMARGAYFLAEQHFTTALTLNPSNPLAQAGLANAQVGAGLTGSSAITLRSLFSDHPELIDARFAPELLPPTKRLQEVLEHLGTTRVDARNASDVGLTLAYVGRQLDDRDAIERGLAMMTGSPGDETLAKLLRGVWLGPRAEPAVPVPAAPAAEDAAPAAPVPAAP